MEKKTSSSPKRGPKPVSGSWALRDSYTGRIVETADRMRVANTSSREAAVRSLQNLGILANDGRLSDKYK